MIALSPIVISLRRAATSGPLLLATAALLISVGSMPALAALPDNQAAPTPPGPSDVPADQRIPADSGARLGIIMYDNNQEGGVKVLRLYAGGPADKMGLQPGDLITAADSKSVFNPAEFQAIVLKHRPGDSVSLLVTRSGWHRTFLLSAVSQADLARLPDFQAAERVRQTGKISPPAVRPSYFTIEQPSEWELIRDPYLRARYTRFR